MTALGMHQRQGAKDHYLGEGLSPIKNHRLPTAYTWLPMSYTEGASWLSAYPGSWPPRAWVWGYIVVSLCMYTEYGCLDTIPTWRVYWLSDTRIHYKKAPSMHSRSYYTSNHKFFQKFRETYSDGRAKNSIQNLAVGMTTTVQAVKVTPALLLFLACDTLTLWYAVIYVRPVLPGCCYPYTIAVAYGIAIQTLFGSTHLWTSCYCTMVHHKGWCCPCKLIRNASKQISGHMSNYYVYVCEAGSQRGLSTTTWERGLNSSKT